MWPITFLDLKIFYWSFYSFGSVPFSMELGTSDVYSKPNRNRIIRMRNITFQIRIHTCKNKECHTFFTFHTWEKVWDVIRTRIGIGKRLWVRLLFIKKIPNWFKSSLCKKILNWFRSSFSKKIRIGLDPDSAKWFRIDSDPHLPKRFRLMQILILQKDSELIQILILQKDSKFI